jgi:putative membrane protein
MYGPKRNNVLFIFDGFVRNFGASILALILLLSGKTTDSFQEILILIVASPVVRLVEYFTTTFEINETYLIIHKGLFTKKKTEIPLATITTVDLTQDLLFQLCKVYKIKIDNTTQVKSSVNQAEAVLVLKKEDALLVKQLLLSHSQAEQTEVSEPSPKDVIEVRNDDFMLLGLMQSKIAFILAILPLLSFILYFFNGSSGQDEVEVFFENVVSRVNSFGSFVTIFLILYLVALAYSLLTTVLNYYRFRLHKNSEYIHIEYGLLNKKKYSLSMEKISGVRLKQNILMRIFKYYTVEVFAIGYGDKAEEGERETAILLPIAKRDKVELLLAKLLPDFELPTIVSKPQIKALPYFFISGGFILSILLLIGLLFTQNVILIAVSATLIVISVIGIIIEYNTCGISINQKNVTTITGKYQYKTTIIKVKSIESASCTASVLKRKKGICHIRFGFIGPKSVAKTTIRNMSIPDYEALKNVMEL